MDAEIRRLTYVQRFAGSKVWSGIPDAARLIDVVQGAAAGDEVARHPTKLQDVRFETRILELESERSESQKRHREQLAAVHESAAETLAVALAEQKEILERGYAAEIAAALRSFREEQKRYFQDAESAVVRLALGIAARVMHREAQLDPLLLRGAVRVALEDAQQGDACVVEVADGEVDKWRQWLSAETTAPLAEVRGKEDAEPGHCRVEIGASTADLSVHAQLAEIERGFFDLLQCRPLATGAESEKSR